MLYVQPLHYHTHSLLDAHNLQYLRHLPLLRIPLYHYYIQCMHTQGHHSLVELSLRQAQQSNLGLYILRIQGLQYGQILVRC